MTEIEVWRRHPLEARMLVWTGENWKQMSDFTKGAFRVFRPDPNVAPVPLGGLQVQVFDRLHVTWINVAIGQRIVEGARGEFYPIDPEVLAGEDALYERVS